MMSDFLAELEKTNWNFETRRSQKLMSTISIVLFGLIPFLTILLGLNFPDQTTLIYSIGKLAMLLCSIKPLIEVFKLASWKEINIKRLGLTTTLLASAPLLLLTLNPFLEIDSSGIEKHLQKFQLEHHLIYLVSFLCLFNALLEETFFRGFLDHPSMQKSHLKAINAFLFMPHHLVITLVYFPLPLALLFTLATGVAGWAWMNQRLNGAKIPELWISHFILDIIVIGGALISFNLI